jgi:hypothetical protein
MSKRLQSIKLEGHRVTVEQGERGQFTVVIQFPSNRELVDLIAQASAILKYRITRGEDKLDFPPP